jgi:hypothetical protein
MKANLVIFTMVWSIVAVSPGQTRERLNLGRECRVTLEVLGQALLKTQVTDSRDSSFGALRCPESGLFHTRAAEAVYPFAVLFKQTKDEKYRKAAVELGNWLNRQQQPGGEWLETPWVWTGTTADQLLMMSLAYPILEPSLSNSERASWKRSIEAAAQFLLKTMSPDFATINYCGTTPASLMTTNAIFPNPAYVRKAQELSRMVLSKMNDDGFIEGEAARVGNVKYGVDPGYEMDMTFWGLLLYARLNKDAFVENTVRKAVESHLNLVYPNGIIDGSWGTRCYKWTTYGSKTADGTQILFSMLANADGRYRTAAWRNLQYLRSMMKNGLIGSGPQYFSMTSEPPCNYPTFARAKNLAMAAELGDRSEGPLPPLPSDKIGSFKYYPTVNVALARTEMFYVTISGYDYVDQLNWGQGRYSQFPSGGSACNIWVKDFGLLQTSSPTRYVRGEVIHMPDIKDTIRCFTPRIEYADSGGYFTNLYERSGLMSVQKERDGSFSSAFTGELKNEKHLPGGVGYRLNHRVEKTSVQKSIELRYHDGTPEIAIVEPIVYEEGMQVNQVDPGTVRIRYAKKEFLLKIEQGNVRIELGKELNRYWQPFPAMRCYPIVLKVDPPEQPFENENFRKKIVYRFVSN